MKEKMKDIGKTFGGIVCVVAGMALTYFGVTTIFPKKKYSHSEVKAD